MKISIGHYDAIKEIEQLKEARFIKYFCNYIVSGFYSTAELSNFKLYLVGNPELVVSHLAHVDQVLLATGVRSRAHISHLMIRLE